MVRRLGFALGIALVGAAIAYVLYDAWAWDRAAKVVDSGFHELVVGKGSERVGGIFLDNDSYYWLGYARRMGNGEGWRIRHTAADNAPGGRPVHWSQSISWLLVILGKLRQFSTNEAWPIALERASIWLSPLLLVVLIGSIGWALFRQTGPVAAGLFMVVLVTLGDVGWAFHALRPGHQTLHCLLGLLILAGLTLGGGGWIRSGRDTADNGGVVSQFLRMPHFRAARRWFLLSGLCTALSLWVSAVVTTVLLAMIFGGALLLIAGAPPVSSRNDMEPKPELWRWWGWIAGAGSLLLYLLEYFPNHLGFRLEVNSPVYSIAVVAMGEAMCQFLRARYAQRNNRPTPLWRGFTCTALVVCIPLAIFFGPRSWHALRDPQMLLLHNFIQEFYSLPRFAGPHMTATMLKNVGILPFFFLLTLLIGRASALYWQEKVALWLSFVVALGFLAIGYMQIRWLSLYAMMNAWLALVCGVCAWRLFCEWLPRRWQLGVVVLLVALLLVQPVLFANRRNRQVGDIIRQHSVPRQLVEPVLNKRMALAFRAQEGPGARVMADLDVTPALAYFADASGVAAFYWEDLEGLHAATQFFADSEDGGDAKQIALERNLTHVIVQEGNRLQNYFYVIATGKIDQAAAAKVFAARLVGSEFGLPDWLQTTPALQNIGFQVYAYNGMRIEDRWRIYRISRGP